jgi:MFS family permease
VDDSLLGRRDVRLIVAAVGLSALGDFLAFIPLMLQMQEMTGSGIAVSAVLIALWAPIVALAPLAGLAVDRFETRRLLILVSAAQAVVAVALALASDSVAGILVFSTLLGIGFALAQPAEFALVPVIAGDAAGERLNRLNGYIESSRYTGMALGPLLGGVLAGAGGTKVALLANALSFVVVALAALRLDARRPPQAAPAAGEAHEHDRAREGIAVLFRDRRLGLVIAIAFVSLLFFTASATAEVFFAKDVLEVGDAGYGLLMTGWTIGMVLGAIVVAPRVAPAGLALGALVAIGVQGIGIGLPAAWLMFGFAVVLYSIGGAGHGAKNVMVRTLIQLRVPDRLHGRAFAAYNGLRNGAELFALATGGVLVGLLGARATLALAGGLPLLAALAGLALYRGRDRPRREPVVARELRPRPQSSRPTP